MGLSRVARIALPWASDRRGATAGRPRVSDLAGRPYGCLLGGLSSPCIERYRVSKVTLYEWIQGQYGNTLIRVPSEVR